MLVKVKGQRQRRDSAEGGEASHPSFAEYFALLSSTPCYLLAEVRRIFRLRLCRRPPFAGLLACWLLAGWLAGWLAGCWLAGWQLAG